MKPTNSRGPSAPIIIYVYASVIIYAALFPKEFWDALEKLVPPKRPLALHQRPQYWAWLVTDLVYRVLDIEDLLRDVSDGFGRWHQHLDRHGRRMVRLQCLWIVYLVDKGADLREVRRQILVRRGQYGNVPLLEGLVPGHSPRFKGRFRDKRP